MGTNYYAVPAPNVEIHLGKMSAGWPFLFRFHDGWEQDMAMMEWVATASSYPLKDEYGREIDFSVLLDLINQSLNTHTGKTHEIAEFRCGGWQFSRKDFC